MLGSKHMTDLCDAIGDLKDHINRAIEVEVRAKRIPNRSYARVLLNVKVDDCNAGDPIYEALLVCEELFKSIYHSIAWGWYEKDFPKWMFTHSDLPNIGVVVLMGDGERCARCYRISTQVGTHADWDDLCDRCAEVMRMLPADHPFFTSQAKD